MPRFAAALLAVLPTLAAADAGDFIRLSAKAETLPSLASFLEKYVGDCEGSDDRRGCEAQARAYREKVAGKRFRILLSEDEARMLAPGGFGDDGYSVKIAPLFAAGGYAVTHGAPRGTDAHGNPVVNWLEAREDPRPEWDARQFERLFSLRSLRAQVVFTPNGVWTLPKKGGGKQHGVKARVEAVHVTVARTGETVATWLAR